MMHPQMPRGTSRSAPPMVGFFGCAGDVGRLSARQAVSGEEVRLSKCPCCGHGHTVKPFWRRWMQALDLGRPLLDIDGAYDALPETGACTRG